MTPQELKQHRIQLFRDCAAWRKPERVPFLANIVTWKIIDSGYKFSEALLCKRRSGSPGRSRLFPV